MSGPTAKIPLIDDDRGLVDVLSMELEDAVFAVETAASHPRQLTLPGVLALCVWGLCPPV